MDVGAGAATTASGVATTAGAARGADEEGALEAAVAAAVASPSDEAWGAASSAADRCLAARPASRSCRVVGARAKAAVADDPGAHRMLVEAIRAAPTELPPYLALAELLLAWSMPSEAAMVLEAALGRADVADPAMHQATHLLLARAHADRGDEVEELDALARAHALGDAPAILFALGSALVRAGRTEAGARLLTSFSKRACRGAAASRFVTECESTLAMLGVVGQSSGAPDVTPPPPARTRKMLPDVPAPPRVTPQRADASYDVRGLLHDFRVHERRYRVKAEVTVSGIVVDTNFGAAPACAVHARGKADPKGCVAPLPSFRLADEPRGPSLVVLGFASNFAALHDAREHDRRAPTAPPLTDTFWGVPLPRPVPAPGAVVRVTGTIATTFTRASSGIVVDPGGVLTYASLTTTTPASSAAVLGPGVGAARPKQP